MANAKQTWRVELDEETREIRYFTRSDDALRQTFKVDDLPEKIRNLLAIRGVKVTIEERNSSIPASAVQASLDARQEVWDMWLTGTWAKQRQGGGFSVKIEIQALASLKGTTTTAIREALKDLPEEKVKALFQSKAVKDKIRELQETEQVEELNFDDMI